MSAVVDSLVSVPKEEWLGLKDRFRDNRWPFGLTAYNTILTQHHNVQKDPNYPVKIYSVFGDPDNGVICIVSQLPSQFEISVFCMKDDTSKITEALVNSKQIDWTHSAIFCSIMKDHVKCCVDALNQLGRTEMYFDDTYVAQLEKKDALMFDIVLPEGCKLEIVPPEKAEELDNDWPHRHPNSLCYFTKMLTRGAALGMWNNDLRAWGLISTRGDLHAITTKPAYRRNGYAQIIIKTLSKRLAEEGKEIYGCIVVNNEPSKKLFTNLGFKFIGISTWIRSMPKKMDS